MYCESFSFSLGFAPAFRLSRLPIPTENKNMRTPINAILPCALSLAVLQALQPAHAEPLAARLDRLTVVGSVEQAQETTGSAHYIDSQQLEKHNYRDVNRVLREVPGVYLVEEEGYGLRPNIGIRGSGTDRNNRITVMEDGVLIAPAPYAAPAAYYFPTMARMSAVEVRKGSSSVKAGPRTTGGVINLLSTPIPTGPAGLVDLSYGRDNTLLGHTWAGTSQERFGFLVEGVYQRSDGFKRLDGGGDTGYRLDDVLAKVRVNSDSNAARYQELELKVSRTTQDSDETYLGLTDADFRAMPNRRYAASQLDNIATTHELAQVNHFIELADNVDLTTVAYRTEFARNWYKLNDVRNSADTGWVSLANILANPATFADQYAWLTGATSPDGALRLRNNNRKYYAQGIQSVLGWKFAGTAEHNVEFGLRWHRDEEDRFQDDDRYRMQDGRLVLTSDGAPGTQDNRVASAEAFSAYVQDEIRYGRWIITPGVRFERIRLTREDFALTTNGRDAGPTRVLRDTVDAFIPGLGVTWLLSDDLTVFGSLHRGYNPPAPGTGVDAEESVNGEFGLRYASNGLRGELLGFWNEYDNLIGTCTASTGGGCNIGDQFDGGKARIRGIEANLGYRFRAGALNIPVSAAYTFTRAEFRNAFTSSFGEWGTVASGDRLPYLPEHLFNAQAGIEGERWRINLAANYIDDMRTRAGQGTPAAGQRTDAAWVFDLSAGWQLTDNAELYARVENLFDETYIVSRRPSGARPGQPRTGFVGMRYRF